MYYVKFDRQFIIVAVCVWGGGVCVGVCVGGCVLCVYLVKTPKPPLHYLFIIHPFDPTVVICYLIWPCDVAVRITYLISHSSS